MADLRLRIGAEDNASATLKRIGASAGEMGASLVSASKAAAAAAAAFVAHGVKALVEEEQAQRRLASAAGALSGAFTAQASALEKSLGVSQEHVMAMQAMLLRYGEAPEKVSATVKALLDYSAATGEDAVSATRELITSVDTGRRAFKELGLSVDHTGTKSEQLGKYTDALGAKLGGASEADAESFAGKAKRAASAVDDIAKQLASMVLGAEEKLGVLDRLRVSLGAIAELFEPSEFTRRERLVETLNYFEKITKANADMEHSANHLSRALFAGWATGLRDARKALEEFNASQSSARVVAAAAGGVPHPLGLPETGGEQRTGKQVADDAAAAERSAAARKKAHADAMESARKNAREVAEALAEADDDEAKRVEADDAAELKRDEDAAEASMKRQLKLYSDMTEAARKASEDMERAGAAVGMALVGSIASAIEQAQSGGEVDVASTVIGTISSIVSTVLSFVPGASAFAPLVGMAGGALAQAVRKRHEGGWVDAPRFHDGAWVGADEQPAILQSGERVLSRSEVARMGGPTGVDASAGAGGAGPRITVNALDGSTAREYFERAGGRALLNAVRTGRGAPSLLFGG